nr:MAG TPA: hypothetical protein [Caudoviricetes sp.]DAH62558.1 MAG TPA: hypothetical protein [Caudoviricetes sp.]
MITNLRKGGNFVYHESIQKKYNILFSIFYTEKIIS